MNFTLQDIIKIAGQPTKERNGHIYFRCPECAALGGDNSGDNLIYTPSENLLYCFVHEEHSKNILRQMHSDETIEKTYQKPIEQNHRTQQWEINQMEYVEYAFECNQALLTDNSPYYYFDNLTALEYLYKHRLISKETIEICEIGFDFDDKKWVFPVYPVAKKGTMYGFRYRGYDLKNKSIWSEKDTPSCVMSIKGKPTDKNLYICEGEFDALVMVEILRAYKKLDYSSIYSPSMGVSNLKNCINKINFENYENVYLCLDNDIEKRKIIVNGKSQDVSLQMTKELIERHPFLIDKTPKFTDEELKLGNKDITDWWKIHILRG